LIIRAMLNTEVQVEAAVRCSIIFSAGNDSSRLKTYLLFLREAKLPENYELVVINDQHMQFDESQLGEFRLSLKVLNVDGPLQQQQLFDTGAMAAKGKFLLFVRSLGSFDKLTLQESIQELENSGENVSVSANGIFVLAERSHYTSVGGFAGLFNRFDLTKEEAVFMASCQISHFRNLYNEPVLFKCSPGTFIDPGVIIDSPKSVKIGSNCIIRNGVVLRPESGEIIIGDNCVINHYCVFHGRGGIYLGDWTIVAPHCGFYAQNHTYESFDVPITKQPSTGKGIYVMGDNWIGGHSVICDDVTIGKGAVIGANSTVTKSIPMASVAVGSPAKAIKKRYSGDWDFHKQERAAANGMSDEINQHVRERGMILKELIDAQDNILDVGCGEGIITAILAEKARSIVGCDYSIEAINVAKKHHPHIEFIYSNSTSLAFDDQSFAKVILSDVVEHLMPVQFIKTLLQMNRVLKAEGQVILTTPITGKGKNTSTYAHIYEYSENEIQKILSEIFCNVKFINKEFGIFVAHKGLQ